MFDENDSIALIVEDDTKTSDTTKKCVIAKVEDKYYLFSNISLFNGKIAPTFPGGYKYSWVLGDYNFDEIIEALNKEDHLSEILGRILDTGAAVDTKEDWLVIDWQIVGSSETKKQKDNTFKNKEKKMPETKKMFGGMNISDLLKFKMLSEMLKDGNDISFEKVAMFNCLSGGSFEISEVLKAKLMSSLMKDDKAIENLPVEKLMVIQMLEDGEFDAQKLLEFKLAEKLLAE